MERFSAASVHGAHADYTAFEYEPTLATLLADSGYQTLAISNNTWISDEFGYGRGFDDFVSTWKVFQDAVDFGRVARTETGVLGKVGGVLRNFSGNPVKNIANLVYGKFFRKREDDGAARTNEILADRIPELARSEDPFFLFVNYLEPHLEYRPPEHLAREYLPDDITLKEAMSVNQDAWAYVTGAVEMTDREFSALRALYRAELDYLDGRIENLLDLFVKNGALDETIFAIVGDHGENIGDHGLMDHQYSLHETLLNVPLILAGPNSSDGRTVDEPVQLLDIFPTLLDGANVDLDGIDPPGTSLLTETVPTDRNLYAEYLAPQPAVETLRERYNCRKDVSTYDRRLWAVKRDGYKRIHASDGSEWCYHLETDPEERYDLTDSEAQSTSSTQPPDIGVCEALAERLEEWIDSRPSLDTGDVQVNDVTEDRLEDLGYL
jgi:arylsulfatase A-like enzyme